MHVSIRLSTLGICLMAACTAGHTDAQTTTAITPTASEASGYLISYVCGDATLDQHLPPTSDGHAYNLGVSFASAQTGEALSNVTVRLRRHGRILLDFTAAGPRCLFSVPDAEYRLEGTYGGEMKYEIIGSGSLNTQMRW
jgi:hypothetical protein